MNELHDSWFAYPSMRLYPVHTSSAAVESYERFSKDAANLAKPLFDDIAERFSKAAEYHGITYPVPVEAVAPTKYTFTFKGASGEIKMGLIKDAADLEQASAFLIEKRASMFRSELGSAAKYVLMRASALDAPMDTPAITKVAHIAGIGVGDREQIQDEFGKRATIRDLSSDASAAFWAFHRDMQSLTDEEFYKEANLVKICGAMESIDKLYSNEVRYGRELQAPEDVVFAQGLDDLLKEAADLMHIDSIDTTLSKKALLERERVTNAFFRQHFADHTNLYGEALIQKVAGLDVAGASALLEAIE